MLWGKLMFQLRCIVPPGVISRISNFERYTYHVSKDYHSKTWQKISKNPFSLKTRPAKSDWLEVRWLSWRLVFTYQLDKNPVFQVLNLYTEMIRTPYCKIWTSPVLLGKQVSKNQDEASSNLAIFHKAFSMSQSWMQTAKIQFTWSSALTFCSSPFPQVGLAVGDIDAIQKSAFIRKEAKKISFLLEIETKFPKFITRRLYKPIVVVRPNRPENYFKRCD